MCHGLFAIEDKLQKMQHFLHKQQIKSMCQNAEKNQTMPSVLLHTGTQMMVFEGGSY